MRDELESLLVTLAKKCFDLQYLFDTHPKVASKLITIDVILIDRLIENIKKLWAENHDSTISIYTKESFIESLSQLEKQNHKTIQTTMQFLLYHFCEEEYKNLLGEKQFLEFKEKLSKVPAVDSYFSDLIRIQKNQIQKLSVDFELKKNRSVKAIEELLLSIGDLFFATRFLYSILSVGSTGSIRAIEKTFSVLAKNKMLTKELCMLFARFKKSGQLPIDFNEHLEKLISLIEDRKKTNPLPHDFLYTALKWVTSFDLEYVSSAISIITTLVKHDLSESEIVNILKNFTPGNHEQNEKLRYYDSI